MRGLFLGMVTGSYVNIIVMLYEEEGCINERTQK
jgi:hypothetical protein